MLKRRVIKVWWHTNNGLPNFGDILNPYLVEKMSGREVRWSQIKRFSFHKVYVIVGSVLQIVNRNCIVWGAGIIDRKHHIGPAKFLAVRGPLTGKRLVELGYKDPGIYGDPALLLPRYYRPSSEKKYLLGIIPHHVDYDFVVSSVSDPRIKVVRLLNDCVESVIQDIASCEYTISSSLHGIIVSHAYNIPSFWVRFSDKLYGDGVKFSDYLSSVGIDLYEPRNLAGGIPPVDRILKYFAEHSSQVRPQLDLKDIATSLLSVCPFYNQK